MIPSERELPGQDSNLDKESQSLSGERRNSLPDKTSSTASRRPDRARTKALQADADLARIIAAWPALPEPIRRAMLALADRVK